MSALGHKRTFGEIRTMSALLPKADIAHPNRRVRYLPKADIGPREYDQDRKSYQHKDVACIAISTPAD